MRYLPHTEDDITAMLDVIGVKDFEELFSSVPKDCRRASPLDLPGPLTEWELNDHMAKLAETMATAPGYSNYTGAGSYEHFIPETLSYLLSRSEFVTCYTPYQPEMTQGTLQAIYEYQTLVARLLGLEVANASLYDGASALAEALLMAVRITKRRRIAMSALIHPHYRQVVKTYFQPTDCEILELPYLEDGTTDTSSIEGADDLAAVAVQSPNFFGVIEDLKSIRKKVNAGETLFIQCFTEPLAFGLIKSPGSQGVDIACGEGQSFGIPQSFGGPTLGMFAAKMAFVRNMPGRIVGQTTDQEGKRGFVLTLATREQHIRRERATSNICTNNSLCALASAMYMALLGGTGLRELSSLNRDKTEYLKGELLKAGFKMAFEGPTFNEFVVEFPSDFGDRYQRLVEKKIIPGLSLAPYYPELADHYLLCVTETKSKKDLDNFVQEVST